MSFEQDFIHGYKKYEKYFDNMCRKASLAFGHNITQCGFFEFDSTGHAYIATNRPDFGEANIEKQAFKINPNIVYRDNIEDKIVPYCGNPYLRMIHQNNDSFFDNEFNLGHGFFRTVKLKGEDAYRSYFFGSDSFYIYNEIFNSVGLIKKFIAFFEKESADIVKYYRDHKFYLAGERDDYFGGCKNAEKTEQEKLISLLHSFNVLDQNISITNREWQCFELYRQGKSANQTGKILGISNRTVETHFDRLKSKLEVSSKSELIEYLS